MSISRCVNKQHVVCPAAECYSAGGGNGDGNGALRMDGRALRALHGVQEVAEEHMLYNVMNVRGPGRCTEVEGRSVFACVWREGV